MTDTQIIKPSKGEKYRCLDGRLFHVLYSDDEFVAYKWWRRAKNRWEYKAEDIYIFSWSVHTKHYEKVK